MEYEIGEYYQTKRGSILKLVKADRALFFKRVCGQDNFVSNEYGEVVFMLDTQHKFKKLSNKKILEVLYGN